MSSVVPKADSHLEALLKDLYLLHKEFPAQMQAKGTAQDEAQEQLTQAVKFRQKIEQLFADPLKGGDTTGESASHLM